MRILDSQKIGYKFIHTGQHYDYNLSSQFFEEFGIPKPDYTIDLTEVSSQPARQISRIILKADDILEEFAPSLVLVQGDTNSVLASSLAAAKRDIPIAHLEAGLRSEDWKTTEEHNRRVVDHLSDILFAPTIDSARNLENERVKGDIHLVGNTAIDAVSLFLDQVENNNHGRGNSNERSNVACSDSADFVLVTLHRADNVDNIEFLKNVLLALNQSELNYIFPVHPHTAKRIREFRLEGLITQTIKIIEPVNYSNFLWLLKKCKFVITDSGGVQEEITYPSINKHALVLRNSTERPESVRSGHAVLCRPSGSSSILQAIKVVEKLDNAEGLSPYGDGNTAERVVQILQRYKI